ncbi:hypothetical protein KKA17_08305 [bacterium]|nr:hypothetical protein [bacterium]MBU1884410.1 hypothetical protein [bacterium]
MKRFSKYMNVYFVSSFFAFFAVVYLVSLVMMNSNISKGSSVEIYHEQLKKERMMKQQQ